MLSPNLNAPIFRAVLECSRRGQERILQPVVTVYKYTGNPGKTRVCVRVLNRTDHDFNQRVGANVLAKVAEINEPMASFHTGYASSVPANSRQLLRCRSVDAPAGFLETNYPQV